MSIWLDNGNIRTNDFDFLPYLDVFNVGFWNDWLYDQSWDAQKYNRYLIYKQIPYLSQGIVAAEGKRSNEEYMNRYDLTWDDVMHPEKLPGSVSLGSAYRASLNFVSSNVKRLYR